MVKETLSFPEALHRKVTYLGSGLAIKANKSGCWIKKVQVLWNLISPSKTGMWPLQDTDGQTDLRDEWSLIIPLSKCTEC